MILDPHAVQGQRRSSSPHPQAAASGYQLGRVRGRPAPAREPDGLVHRGGDRGLARRAPHHAGRCIAERGRMGWQRASGYGWRALVEADISRWKRVIGDGLRSQTDGRQASEVAIAADVLNRILELGRPEYVRIA